MVGSVAQLAGIGIDAWLHLRDPSLASREALLDLTNLGHVLLLGGIALVAVGAGLLVLGPRLAAARRPVRIGVPLALALVVGAASLAASNSSLAVGGGHDHGATEHGGHDSHAEHGHGSGSEPPYEALDREERALLTEQLTLAREVALRYPDRASAEAAGYRPVTAYVPLIGAHLMRFATVDGTFDITQPEMLLYGPDDEMVGLSYYVTSPDAPEGFAGPNDHWHRHLGLCIDPASNFVVGDEATTDEECARLGGTKVDGSDGWMVHAWVVPGWDSPDGVFSAANEQLL